MGNQTNWEGSMRQAFLMAGEGLTVRKIADELTLSGVRRPNGKAVNATTLWRHLTDPAYAGIGRSRRTFGLRETLVSRRLFFGVQERLRSKDPLSQKETRMSDPTD